MIRRARFLAFWLLATAAVTAVFVPALAQAASPSNHPVRIILVGDSTMATRSGYGDALCRHFTPDVACINLARGGRSSASFRAEGRWAHVMALLADSRPYAATYVLIQFGHNDQPGKPGRSTDLLREFPHNMARYASEVTARGGIPVLLTPLTRRSFRGAWLQDDLGPWAAATRQVAQEQKTALLDLLALSSAAVQAMGEQEADALAQAPRPAPDAASSTGLPSTGAASNAALEPQGTPAGVFDRTHVGAKGAAFFAHMVAAELLRLYPALAPSLTLTATRPLPTPAWARQQAPDDGWAALDGGTRGGAAASAERIFTVTSRAELLAAIAAPGQESRIIQVRGMIDMRPPAGFADSAAQAAEATVRIPSHTTLIGLGAGAGFINAQLQVYKVTQVIIRNLQIRNPCDVAPVWDPKDGATGNWNSLFDGVSVSASTHVWIDHNSFTDAPLTDDSLPTENGMLKQCHDGALDITNGSDFITVSYNHFALHEKNMLIGGSDRASGDAGHLNVTLSHNLFEHVSSRAPRVRFGKVHLFNNYHVGDRAHAVYPHSYSIGIGLEGKILAHHNAFDIKGARDCRDIVRNYDRGTPPGGAFLDSGSLLNGAPLTPCQEPDAPGWQLPYPFKPLAAHEVKAHVLRYAGAGKFEDLAAPAARAVSSGLFPAPGEPAAQVDTLLRLRFDAPPVAGAGGTIRIFRATDDALIDTIRTGDETDQLGYAGQAQRRHLNLRLISIDGNSASIRLHSDRLRYATSYYVTVSGDAFSGATMNDAPFRGIDKAAGWGFRTRARPPSGSRFTVDDDGPADFRSLQGALNHVMKHLPRATPVRIDIADGRYEEMLFVRDKDNLTIRGQSREGVHLYGHNNNGRNAGSGASQIDGTSGLLGGRAVFLIEQADLLTLENLSITNITLRSEGPFRQAETLFFNDDHGRLIVKEANFFSEQDTIQLKGFAWFYRALVAGNVDFIWGANRVALFEDSEIRSVGDSANPASGGYVLQARSLHAEDKGFVFLNSRLTNGPGPGRDANAIPAGSSYLARSPGRHTSWDNVAFIGCRMDQHIAAAGWAGAGVKGQPAPNPAVASATSGWREYDSRDMTGKPLELARRVGGHLLSAEEVRTHFADRAMIFSAYDGGKGWRPLP